MSEALANFVHFTRGRADIRIESLPATSTLQSDPVVALFMQNTDPDNPAQLRRDILSRAQAKRTPDSVGGYFLLHCTASIYLSPLYCITRANKNQIPSRRDSVLIPSLAEASIIHISNRVPCSVVLQSNGFGWTRAQVTLQLVLCLLFLLFLLLS